METLTDKQRDAILRLGSNSNFELIDEGVFDRLKQMGIVGKRHDGVMDFTSAGEAIYKKLRQEVQPHKPGKIGFTKIIPPGTA